MSKLTPPQGTNYPTQYPYNKNGSLSHVKVYDAGTAADTDYTYNTTSGKLTQRDNPVVSSANIRTAYAYDAAGHARMLLLVHTLSMESGGKMPPLRSEGIPAGTLPCTTQTHLAQPPIPSQPQNTGSGILVPFCV